MAFHAIKADEGSAFVCAGVESSTRAPLGVFCDQPDTQNPRLQAGNAEGLPQAYMAMGETGRERGRQAQRQPGGDGPVRPAEPPARGPGRRERHLRPGDHPGAAGVRDHDGRRRARSDTSLERLSTLKPVFRADGRITAGNSCPLNDGAAPPW